MNGHEIIFRGDTINIAPKFNTGVFITQRNGYFNAVVSGLENVSEDKMLTHKWLDSNMQIGDTIEINIKDLDLCSEPTEVNDAFIDLPPLTKKEIEVMLEDKLADFYTLEKLLKDEGLI